MKFHLFELNLNQMTLVVTLDLDIVDIVHSSEIVNKDVVIERASL